MALSKTYTKPGALEVVDHFFRHQHSKIIASFTARYGFEHLESVEDAVQDALVKAMQIWPYKSIPRDPSAWIFRVTNNLLIDKLRRAQKTDWKLSAEEVLKEASIEINVPSENEVEDDQLKMMFACCHPSLPEETQIMLTLYLLCGFGTPEIARALLKRQETVAKALTRGKTRFRKDIGTLELPPDHVLQNRLKVVMKVVYLLFNEGYKVTKGEKLFDDSVAFEAIRLGSILVKRYGEYHELNALMALMHYQVSRFNARVDPDGNFISMQDQDRNLWDQESIALGNQYLAASAQGNYLTDYHIQAGIAAIHCSATSFETTNWSEMLQLYDLQVSFNRLPIAELNRIVPFSKVKGPQAGLAEIDGLKKYPKLLKVHLFYAIKAELLEELGRYADAINELKTALQLVENDAEKRYMKKKLARLIDNAQIN